ncbi:MAG TPA: PD-(D/E)XK nuclease family protein [Fimbriimonadales bacterium]|jgi:RecB family exonuclease|nr:PD-(D/E)XK nuclease family protein [Fimbriimonadales bacterium]
MRKPTVSPSRITTYLACPVKYRWTYVDPRGRWYLRAKHYYSFGLNLHAALQRFHDSSDLGVTTTEEAVASMEENWITAGFATPEEAEEALAEGRELVTTFLEGTAEADAGSTTLFVEKRLSLDFGDFALVGRLDRVDERADGTLEIIDYKSGGERKAEELESDVAMNVYALLLRQRFPQAKIRITFANLKTNRRVSADISGAALDSFCTDIHAVGVEVLNRDYENVDPKYKQLCKTCDFLPLCRRHEEFSETFEVLSGEGGNW